MKIIITHTVETASMGDDWNDYTGAAESYGTMMAPRIKAMAQRRAGDSAEIVVNSTVSTHTSGDMTIRVSSPDADFDEQFILDAIQDDAAEMVQAGWADFCCSEEGKQFFAIPA